MTVKFSPEFLSSDHRLNAYMHGKKTIKAIKAEAKQPYVQGYGRLGTLQVIWLVATLPVHVLFSQSLKLTGNLLHLLQARTLGQKLLVRAYYLEQVSIRWIFAINYGNNLLVSTINCLSPDKAEEIYTHPPIPIDNVRSSVLYRASTVNRNNHVHFDKINGQCSGMSDWAAHLYFQTKATFRNEEHHLIAVASQMAHGAEKEAALWQHLQKDGSHFSELPETKARSLITSCQKLIGALKKRGSNSDNDEVKKYKLTLRWARALIDPSHRKLPSLLGIKRIKVDQLIKPTADKVTRVFNDLEPGFYAIRIPHHRFNFIKGKKSDYIMQPDEGLIAIHSAKDFAEQATYLASQKKISIIRLKQLS